MNTETNSHVMETRTLTELEARRDVVEEEIASIKAKLDKVRAEQKATGKWADPDWYRRAVTRQRFLGVEHQKLCRSIAERKREAKVAHNASVERAFVAEAKAEFEPSFFEAMMARARARVAGEAA